MEPRLKTTCSVTKTNPEIKSPFVTNDDSAIILHIAHKFNEVLPPNCRMVIPTGLKFHFELGYSGQLFSVPTFMTNHGLFVPPQLVESNKEIMITVLNFGANELALFENMKIAYLVVSQTPKISRLLVSDSIGREFIPQ